MRFTNSLLFRHIPRLTVTLLAFAAPLLANGGPSGGTDLWGSGNVGLTHQSSTRIVREDLRVALNGEQAKVLVTYRFSHQTDPRNILVCFPVDYEENSEFAGGDADPISAFTVSMDGRPISIGRSWEVTSDRTVGAAEAAVTLKRKWFEFEAPFARATGNVLTVAYSMSVSYADWETNKDFFNTMSPRIFNYTFAPAKYWADGVIDTFALTIDASALLSAGVRVAKTEPFAFSERGGVYTYQTTRFKPGQTPDLRFEYDPSRPTYTQMVEKNRIEPSRVAALRSSSTLKGNYSPDNILDGDFATAWVEGASGSGAGQWIEFSFTGLDGLSYLAIVNGYAKNSNLYYANARIKRVKVEIHYREMGDGARASSNAYERELEDVAWSEYNKNTFISMLSPLGEYGESYIGRPITKIRLTVMDVYPGTKYEDLCVSEVFICAYSLGN